MKKRPIFGRFFIGLTIALQVTKSSPPGKLKLMGEALKTTNTTDYSASNRLMVWAARASVAVALTLMTGKAIVWWLSDSAAMLGSLVDSSLDMASSLVTLLAIKTAIVPPDTAHRFGHGKAEALAGLFQSALMGGSSVFLLLQSLMHLSNPKPIEATDLIIQLSLVAVGLTFMLLLFQRRVMAKTGSLAVAGDHLHYMGDLLLNLGVIVAAYSVQYGFPIVDPVVGILIAFYILYGAYGVLRPAINMLMDREFADEDREAIFNLVLSSKDVRGLHDLRTRQAGRDRFMQMHVEVDGELTVRQAHMIADEVEATLGEAFPDTEIIIHIDPPGEKSIDLTYGELPEQKEP